MFIVRALKLHYTLSATLPDGMRQIELPWTAPPDTPTDDTAGKDEHIVKGPHEYRIEVKIDGTRSDEPSSPLWLTRDISIKIEHEDGTPMQDGTAVRLKQADHRINQKMNNEYMNKR